MNPVSVGDDLVERLKQEAKGHACEARTANSTIYEIYQVISGATGEPGNWHGAQPVRDYVAKAEARIAVLEKALGGLEGACDALAASRGRHTYLSMIDNDLAGDILATLDAARLSARAALTPEPS